MSRFVSGGTQDGDASVPASSGDNNSTINTSNEAWLKAQEQIDAVRQQRQDQGGSGQQEGGKTLFEVLQANKAAKQEAFEESMRLKNQFRSLDEDEVDFLDSVLESTRAKDAAIRKETTEQLDSFRRLQEEAEKAARSEQQQQEGQTSDIGADADFGTSDWQVQSRKRRKTKDKDREGHNGLGMGKGAKLRKLSSSESGSNIVKRGTAPTAASPTAAASSTESTDVGTGAATGTVSSTKATSPAVASPTVAAPAAVAGKERGQGSAGLVAYSSDEDDD